MLGAVRELRSSAGWGGGNNMTTLVVHRVGMHRMTLRPLCLTGQVYRTTCGACTYVEHDDGPVDVVFVGSVVDCMSCLVEETRRQGVRDADA